MKLPTGMLAVVLLGLTLLMSVQCQSRPAARKVAPVSAAQQQQERWRRYWQDLIGVTDKTQLARLGQIEAVHSQAYAQLRQRLDRMHTDLKVGTTQGTLSPNQTESLLVEIARQNMAIELFGLSYWRKIDSLLTPAQRRNRISQVQGANPALMGRIDPQLGLPEEDTGQ